jgi:hypothetical protein
MQASDQPRVERLIGAEHPPRGDPFHGAADPDQARQKPAGARFRNDASPYEDESQACIVGREADVHRQGHGRADSDRRTIDRRDHRLGAVEHAQRELAASVARDRVAALALTPVEGRLPAREIRAGAEPAPGSGDDHHPHVVVAVGVV